MPIFHRSIRLIVLGCASSDCTVLLHHFTSQLCKALAMLYNLFSTLELPEMVQAVRSRNVNLNIVNAPKHLSLFGSLRSIHSEFDPTLDPDVFYKSMKWTKWIHGFMTLAVCQCAHKRFQIIGPGISKRRSFLRRHTICPWHVTMQHCST